MVRYLDAAVTSEDDYNFFGPLRWANSTRNGDNGCAYGEPNAVFKAIIEETTGCFKFSGVATKTIKPGEFIKIDYNWQTVRVIGVCSGV